MLVHLPRQSYYYHHHRRRHHLLRVKGKGLCVGVLYTICFEVDAIARVGHAVASSVGVPENLNVFGVEGERISTG